MVAAAAKDARERFDPGRIVEEIGEALREARSEKREGVKATIQ
jgi:hypothetical protein